MLIPPFWLYTGFLVLVGTLLALDLFVFHRKSAVQSVGAALGWTAFWVTLALSFNGLIYYLEGPKAATEFFAGYLLEQSLSVDNIFVIILILKYFRVAPQYHHKVLFWGIIGAIVMRGMMIAVGSALISNFSWIYFVFGAFLIFTGIKMALPGDDEQDLESNVVVRFSRRFLRLTPDYHQDRFSIKKDGHKFFTPLFVVLLVIEATDLIFAVDSIPAIFAVTQDPFIVFTSNIFAVMGLRSLFFAVAGVMGLFHFLKYGLSIILSFIGVKMFIQHWWHIPIEVSLGVIAVILALSIIASILFPPNKATA
ncbi:MAG: TerC family protein [Chlorobi bacterium]|nr:MAG: TerC family protein [Bacteroidota bacterium]KXK34104.1 MAG: Tellurite resistance protein TerC [Chlorobi bacterium OLB6]MBE2266193.1 TerC family protein [Flavobacteriales bacterium]MBL1161387.1 TerC family protein [Chlorobiota bacterium]MBW7852674.1 TerC family protein [Candidatus Kapabacteria bacterium]MCC6331066.1 TerC family protein [Ignavibacteria bacterium]